MFGEVAEWLKAHAWKACKGATLSWVRIPFSPPKTIFQLTSNSCHLHFLDDRGQ